jgi:hypothetical protein
MKDWHKIRPELFKKQPYYLPGCDSYPRFQGSGCHWLPFAPSITAWGDVFCILATNMPCIGGGFAVGLWQNYGLASIGRFAA